MPTQKKIDEVQLLAEKLSQATVAVAADFSSMPVKSMTGLRKHLRDADVEFRVVKNTLTLRAADEAGRPEVKELLDGPTGLALGFADPLAPIKTIHDYVRTNRLPMVVRAATMMDGRVYKDAQLTLLTTLPPREVLLAQLLGQMASLPTRLVRAINQPLQGLANVMNGPLVGLANVLQARVDQQQGK